MQLTFTTSDLVMMTGKSREQVRLVLDEWERQSGTVLPRGAAKERQLSVEVASLVLGVFKLMYPKSGKKLTMAEAVKGMLQEAQVREGRPDPLRDAVRAELEPLRRLVVEEITSQVLPLARDVQTLSRDLVQATQQQVRQLVGQPDEDTPTLVEDIRSLVEASEEGIEVLAETSQDQLEEVARSGINQVHRMASSGEQTLKQVQETATRQLKATADQVRKEITQELDLRLTEALEKQSTMVSIQGMLVAMGLSLLFGLGIGVFLGRTF